MKKRILAMLLMVIMSISMLASCGNDKPADGSEENSQSEEGIIDNDTQDKNNYTDDESEDVDTGTDTEVNDTETEGTDTETDAKDTEDKEGDKTDNSENKTDDKPNNSEEDDKTQGTQTVTRPDDVNGVEQLPITTKPNGEEILGIGTKDEPYIDIPNLDKMTLETVEIRSGKAVYYEIRSVGGMWLELEAVDAYVITSDGTRYDAKNGKIAFAVESKMANEYVTFQIGNKASQNKSFTIKFFNIKGTFQNPERITNLSGKMSLAEGDQDGHYYIYTATQTGTIRFYLTYTEDSDIVVQNLSTSAVRNMTADAEDKEYIELKVTAGDEIKIQISAIPDRKWNYPATDITWRGEYAK